MADRALIDGPRPCAACQNGDVTDWESFLASFDGEPGYLDWAAFGPLSPSVRAEVHADAELLGSGRPSSIDLVADHAREARDLLAQLLRTDAEQVVLQPSTTYGLMQAIYGLSGGAHGVACGVPEPHGRGIPCRDALGPDPGAVARGARRIRHPRCGPRGADG